VLARILSPSDFGLMGMIMIVIGFAQTFADMGLSNAIIHRQDIESGNLSSFFWANVLSGILLFLLVVLVRPLVVGFFEEPRLSSYLLLAAFIFLITPVGQLFTTLLRKEMEFNTLSKIEIAGAVVYSVSTIALASAHYGVLSLVLGQLIRSLFTVLCLFAVFRKRWMPRFHFSLDEIRSCLSFGAFQMGERAMNYLTANIDYIIIGRILGPTALGFYTLAYNLMIVPLTKINPIITRVAFPTFAKIQNDPSRLQRGYCKASKYISTVTFPMLVGMFAVAPEFVNLVYGPKWEPSIVVLQVLCLVGVFKCLGNPVGSILLAKGRADIGFYINVSVVTLIALAAFIGTRWGIYGVAVAILLLQFPFFLIIQSIVNRLIELSFMRYLKAVAVPAACSAVMFLAVSSLRLCLVHIDQIPLLSIGILAGLVTYPTAYYIMDRAAFREVKTLVTGRL